MVRTAAVPSPFDDLFQDIWETGLEEFGEKVLLVVTDPDSGDQVQVNGIWERAPAVYSGLINDIDLTDQSVETKDADMPAGFGTGWYITRGVEVFRVTNVSTLQPWTTSYSLKKDELPDFGIPASAILVGGGDWLASSQIDYIRHEP